VTTATQTRSERAHHYVRSLPYAKAAARDMLVARGVVRPECSPRHAWKIARKLSGNKKRTAKRRPGVTEAELADAIERLLRKWQRRWASIADLRDALPARVKLTRNDRMASLTRPREPLWHQKVRNLVCHGNAGTLYVGRFVFEEGGIGLTGARC
jgi:hypothetical protein